MKQADATLITTREGSTVRLHDVTPGEVMYLVAANNRIGKVPITDINNKRNIPKIGKVILQTATGPVETMSQVQETDPKNEATAYKLGSYEEIETEKEVERTDYEELNRLARKYRADHLKQLFNITDPRMPETFEEAVLKGMKIAKLGDSMMDGQIAAMSFPG